MTKTAQEIEAERLAEEKQAGRLLAEQQGTALGGLGDFLKIILQMIQGFFGFLNDAISGKTVGDGDGQEMADPSARESLFNGIRASASAAAAWAKYQRDHRGEAVNHTSPISGKVRVDDDRHMREKHPIHGDRRMHHGIDLPVNAPVIASEKGVVLFSGSLTGYGKTVIVGHVDGSYSLYAHLSNSSEMPKAESKVLRGQRLGITGSTGGATGVHLHYEQRRGSESIEPLIDGRIVHRGAELTGAEFPNLRSVGVSGSASAATTLAMRNPQNTLGAAYRG